MYLFIETNRAVRKENVGHQLFWTCWSWLEQETYIECDASIVWMEQTDKLTYGQLGTGFLECHATVL